MKLSRLSNIEDLKNLIFDTGFIPLFRNQITGFSVEELTRNHGWWTGDPETDPWDWRRQLSENRNIAYGKFFNGKSGFISRKWLPYFVAMRRDGYDFESLYLQGKAPGKCRKIMTLFGKYPELPSYEIKKLAGFHSDGEKGFEGALIWLQMMTYITVVKLERKRNKFGEFYGWHVSNYSTTEEKFGYKSILSANLIGKENAKRKIITRLLTFNPQLSESTVESFIK
jgi:hypothetical protein